MRKRDLDICKLFCMNMNNCISLTQSRFLRDSYLIVQDETKILGRGWYLRRENNNIAACVSFFFSNKSYRLSNLLFCLT